MDARIPKILPHIRQENLHFFLLPPEHLREEAERERFEAFFDLDQVPGTDCFLFSSPQLTPNQSRNNR